MALLGASGRRFRPALALVAALALLGTLPVGAADPLDYPVPGGWFYTQANGKEGDKTGFAVIDDSKAPFYREFRRLGGVPVVGYPISTRFVWDGFETQAFQKLILQWRPEKNTVDFVNVFDKINDNNQDDWLLVKKGVPRQAKFEEQGKPIGEIQRDRLMILDTNPEIKKFYFAVPGDAIQYNGLPTSPIIEVNNANVLRAQRIVLQHWKVNVPWARAGDVTVANGGDVAKEAGILPGIAILPRNSDGSLPAGAATATPTATGTPRAAAATATPSPTPTVVLRPIEGPITVDASVDTPLKSGGEGKITVRVKEKSGKVVAGALVTILVHFPLKPDDTAYSTDLILFIQTNSDGIGTVTPKVPTSVPAGVPIAIEVSALYPPHVANVEIKSVVS